MISLLCYPWRNLASKEREMIVYIYRYGIAKYVAMFSQTFFNARHYHLQYVSTRIKKSGLATWDSKKLIYVSSLVSWSPGPVFIPTPWAFAPSFCNNWRNKMPLWRPQIWHWWVQNILDFFHMSLVVLHSVFVKSLLQSRQTYSITTSKMLLVDKS